MAAQVLNARTARCSSIRTAHFCHRMKDELQRAHETIEMLLRSLEVEKLEHLGPLGMLSVGKLREWGGI